MKEDIMIYAFVPKEIYQTKKLTPEEKSIYERISSLCCNTGYSWITNKSLASLYGIRIDTVVKHIKKIEKNGYIRCSYEKIDNKSKRIIYLTDNLWDKHNTSNMLNVSSDIGYSSKHNNKKNSNIIYKSPIYEKDNSCNEYWNGIKIESYYDR
ncbi:MAG: helix-turn-helix domain-containing protein [Bacilli bacterium]